MMTLNIARANPIYFSNNVLEAIRDRIHSDKLYYTFSNAVIPTEEGIHAIDTLIEYICKQPKMKGLAWNTQIA